MDEKLIFRQTMSKFATGVTVIAVNLEGKVAAMTANAVTSVSLDPMLLLVCIRNNSHMAKIIEETKKFSINILAASQESISNFYGGKKLQECSPEWIINEIGHPELKGSHATISCDLYDYQQAGDHTVYYGSVVKMTDSSEEKSALVFLEGKYINLPIAA